MIIFAKYYVMTVTALSGHVFNNGCKSYCIFNTNSNRNQSNASTNGKDVILFFYVLKIIEAVSSFSIIDWFFLFDIFFSLNLLHFWMNANADGLKTWKSRAKCTPRTNWKWFRITHKPLKIKYFEQFTCYQKRNVSSVQFLV